MAEQQTQQQSQEEIMRQKQMQAQWQKQMMLNQIGGYLQSTDPITILKAVSSNLGPILICPNQMFSWNLLQVINNDLVKSEMPDDLVESIANALNTAISYTNCIRMQMGGFSPMGGFGGMSGMGMGFGGMNPMMMGMPIGGMMGMGGFGGFGFNQTQMPNGQDLDANQKIANQKNWISQNIQNADPLVFLSIISRGETVIDFSEDTNFRNILTQTMFGAISVLGQMQFQQVFYIIFSLYQSDMQKQWQKNAQNGGNQQNSFMNPMMMGMGGFGGIGMGMPGMGMGFGGMNPMMMGMPMGGMMGMQLNGNQDQNNQQNSFMNPMMMGMGGFGGMGMGMPGMGMGFGGMNPMMGAFGMMNPVQMPGMSTNTGSQGSVWM